MDQVLTTKFVGELIGSFSLIAFGCGINMNLSLNKSYGAGNKAALSGPLAWGFAVAMSVIISSPFNSGGHFNPAVSLGLAVAGLFNWAYVLPYVLAQFIGCFLGAITVWFVYRGHFKATKDQPGTLLGVFATSSSIRENNSVNNFSSEMLATFFLVLIVSCMSSLPLGAASVGEAAGTVGFGAIGALPAGFMIFTIGMAFGGITGWSLNPARDLMPRLAHQILPIEGKGGSDWGYGFLYASIAPLIGASIAGVLYGVIGGYFDESIREFVISTFSLTNF
ncbi:MIP/aquaporin family protein [Apibacter sp. HY039]|uniref:MIP/aquaporin family protein n=1 Tax=Apibacter sp. HY039 TaxID=2501476 RepID=UPI000FEC14EB|nr:MIP/aquaporin family protein [Apibacter sp. HY039]